MPRGHRTDWHQVLEPLLEHGAWALIGRYDKLNTAQVAAAALRYGRVPRPDGPFVFVAKRNAVTGGGTLYARYRPDANT